MLIDELHTYLFDGQPLFEGQPHPLAAPLATWLAVSRRFTTFVAEFRTKIRKKLRATHELESLLDLRLELETAYLLLRERSFHVVYEPQRVGPDFAVTFTTSTLFMVEVTRLRFAQAPGSTLLQSETPTRALVEERLAEVVCIKLGQLPPQRSNVLVIRVEGLRLTPDMLRTALIHLQRRAERNEDAYLERHHFRDRADFFHHHQRLSEILVRGPDLAASDPVIGWINPQAKHPLPGKVRTALYRSHRL